jgi:hypothetical protein
MFFLIRILIWLVGILFLLHLALGVFGYELNTPYLQEQRGTCQQKILACQKNLITSGTAGAHESCTLDCVDLSLLIRKEK